MDDRDETIDATALRTADTYRLMTDLVAPRPIAWVSTLDEAGRPNLAPFSYFQAVCSSPATIVLGISSRADGRPKDTLANILATRELTVSHVDEALAAAMNRTSAEVEPEVDEWTLPSHGSPIAAAPSTHVAPSRVAAAVAALECRLVHAIPLGTGPRGGPSSTLVIARVLAFVVRRGLLQRDGRGRLLPIDPGRLAAVGRLGGIAYTGTAEVFEIPRPSAAAVLGGRARDGAPAHYDGPAAGG